MKILFDVGHPAHVHYCRILAKRLEEQGWSYLFTTKDKQLVIYLLIYYGLQYVSFGKHKKGPIGKIWSLVSYTLRLYLFARKFKPDFFFNTSPSAAFVSWIMGKVHIGLEDTFNMEQVRLYMPFTDVVLTGDYPHPSLGKKEIRYPGYHELAYLHPNVFTSNGMVLDSLGVKKGEKYAVLRLVAWNASHDLGQHGMSQDIRVRIVKELSAHLRVFISSEGVLDDNLKEYAIHIKPEQILDVLYYAHLFIGEGATMASEAAILGTPSIFVHNKSFGSIEDQSSYGLLWHYHNDSKGAYEAMKKSIEIAEDDNAKISCRLNRERMLAEKIDVSAFLIWFVENYPKSERDMRSIDFSFDNFRKIRG